MLTFPLGKLEIVGKKCISHRLRMTLIKQMENALSRPRIKRRTKKLPFFKKKIFMLHGIYVGWVEM